MLEVSNPGSCADDMESTDNEYCGFSTICTFDHERVIERLKKYPEVDLSIVKQYFNNNLVEEFVRTWENIQNLEENQE